MITEQRIRELAAYASDPCADVQHYLAAELLAARETIDDLQVSNSNLIAEALKNDTLRQERDAARAEVERLTAMHGVERRLAESAEARVARLQADVERVAKQRDEARSVAQYVVELIDDGGSSADVWNLCARWSDNWAGSEQPKPAALSIEPRPWWVVLNFESREVPMLHAEARSIGVDFAQKSLQRRADDAIRLGVHPAEVARALDEARAELLAEQPKPAGGA